MRFLRDPLTRRERSERMARIRSKNTNPELAVRKIVHSLGYRFRLHCPKLPGKPDLVLARHKAIIFVHGCFWHRHPDPHCKLARLPKSGLEFWLPKLNSNRDRDIRNQAELRCMGWKILTVWECELRDSERLTAVIRAFLKRKVEDDAGR